MIRLIALSATVVLSLSACELTSPEPSNSETPRPFSEVYSEYIQALSDFQTSSNSEKAEYRANASKVAPTDTIALLPADILPPKGTTVIWSHFNEIAVDTLDLSKSARVPLHDGINICVVSDSIKYTECVTHRMTSSLPAPILSIEGGQFDYTTDSIALTTSRPGALIHFSLDGSYPEVHSPIYQRKIPLDRPLFLRTYAELPGSTRSASTVAIYTAADGRASGIVYDTLVDSRDGQSYPIIQLGSRTWMAKNLNWKASDSNPRSPLFGTQYSQAQIQEVGTSSICPVGWHPSTKSDWDSLISWGTRQPGVTPENFVNALKNNVLRRNALNPKSMFLADSNYIDLFGFRGTTDEFSLRTSGSDTTESNFVDLQPNSIEFLRQPSTYNDGLFLADGIYLPVKKTRFNYVRCVKD